MQHLYQPSADSKLRPPWTGQPHRQLRPLRRAPPSAAAIAAALMVSPRWVYRAAQPPSPREMAVEG